MAAARRSGGSAAKNAKTETTVNETAQTPETKTAVNETAQTPEKTYTEAETQRMIKEAVAEALKEAALNTPKTVLQVTSDDHVTLMASCVFADGCVLSLGDLGQINRPFGTIDVPKKDFLQKRSYNVDQMLLNRSVIVIDGLTPEESERFGLVYNPGETLNQNLYFKILDFSEESAVEIYKHLCPEHKRTVATIFITAFEKGDARVTQSKVQALNRISKSVDPEGLFTPILEAIGENLTKA